MHIGHGLSFFKSGQHIIGIDDGAVVTELGTEREFLRLCSRVLARHPPQHYLQLMVSHNDQTISSPQ